MFNMEIFIFFLNFLKAIFDTSFRLSQLFFGKWNWFVNMVNMIPGWNLPALNFAYIMYHLPKLWTNQFAHENGKQP